MRFFVATAALVCLTFVACDANKEELIRRRDIAVEWAASHEGRAENADFHLGRDWGTHNYGTKSSKSSKSLQSNGPKYSKGKGSYSKTSKSSKPPYYRPPPGEHTPAPHPYAPPPYEPPTSQPTKCPEYDFEKKCTAGSGNAKECPIDASCKPACVPKFCKVPEDPHKIHGHGGEGDGHAADHYVKLGSICGYFDYVEGMPAPRHSVEVCCVVDDDYRTETNYLDYGQCDSCAACKSPQKVNDACCKIALGREDIGRDGDYSQECGDGTCCKCAPDLFTCIGPHDICSESSCQEKCPVIENVQTPNLVVSEVNEPGFGDLDNKYSLGMATFGDYVYVGTLNAPGFPRDLLPWFLGQPLDSTGGKVYRGKTDPYGEWSWELVYDFASSNPNNFGIRKMLVVGDYLYLVTANHEATSGNGAEVWSTRDGVTWSQKSDPGFGIPDNISGRSLSQCGNYLYVGVENRDTGAQLWRHGLSADGDIDGNSWQPVPVAAGGFGNPNNFFISELVQDPLQTDSLYAGTLNGFDGMELWRITSCNEIYPANVQAAPVFQGGWPGPSECPLPSIGPIDLCVTNSGALTLEVVGDALFLGTVNYLLGASLFVTYDGTNFIPVFLFGDGNESLSYVWSMETYRGRLYIGTFGRPTLGEFDFPDNLDFDVNMTGPVEDMDPQDLDKYFELMENLGFSPDMPPLPGITGQSFGEIDLDAIVDGGEFTLFSIDPLAFTGDVLNPFEITVETSESFGSCYPYGVRTMSVYKDSLILGTAGASSKGGTLVFEAEGVP